LNSKTFLDYQDIILPPYNQFKKIKLTESVSKVVDEARLVSSCFNCPSNANPLLSLFLANKGHNV
jgi:hypothetical protein